MKDNKTAYVILGLLSHEDMTGYDIKKRVENTLGFFWSAGYGQIYPALGLLEKQGHVTRTTEVVEKRPKRIVYSITASGLQELKHWLSLPVEREDVKYEILLKLFFGRLSPADKNIGIIEEFHGRNAALLALMQQYKASLAGVLDDSEDHLYYYLTALFGEKVYAAYLDWAKEAVALLEQRK